MENQFFLSQNVPCQNCKITECLEIIGLARIAEEHRMSGNYYTFTPIKVMSSCTCF